MRKNLFSSRPRTQRHLLEPSSSWERQFKASAGRESKTTSTAEHCLDSAFLRERRFMDGGVACVGLSSRIRIRSRNPHSPSLQGLVLSDPNLGCIDGRSGSRMVTSHSNWETLSQARLHQCSQFRNFGTTSVRLSERQSGLQVPKRHQMKQLEF